MPDPQPLKRAVSDLRAASQSTATKKSAPHGKQYAAKNGSSPNRRAATPVCPHCGGSGYLRYDVPYGDPNFGKLRECPDCQTAAARRVQAMLSISSLHGELLQHSFGNFEQTEGAGQGYHAAYAFAKKPEGWLVLHGKNGSGKTHLAAAIANYLRERGVVVLFLTVPDLLDYLRTAFAPKREWGDDNLSFTDRFEAIKTSPVLVLDDFGAESETPWANEKLYQILNYRTDLALPTVVTTNMRLMEIEPRLRSRLCNTMLVKTVFNPAEDYRLRKRA